MAYFKLYIALLLVTAISSIVYAGLLDGILGSQVSQINVLGRLVCTADGNMLPNINNPGIAGVSVAVNCNHGQLSLGTLSTNITGFFDGILKTTNGILFDPSTCVAQAKLPVDGCKVLPPTGVLQAPLEVDSLLDTLLGLVASLLPTPWEVLTV